MSFEKQIAVRHDLCRVLIEALTARDVTAVEAVVAAMGAAATVLGVMPQEMRERIAAEIDGRLLQHANARAKQIHSGAVDRAMTGH